MAAISRIHAVLLATAILWPGLARAQGAATAPPGPAATYVSVQGGWAIMHDSAFGKFNLFGLFEEDAPHAEAVFDSSETLSAAVGYRNGTGWRFEFEVTRWSNAFESIQWNRFVKFGTYVTSGEIETISYMANAIADIPLDGYFDLYLGFGLGGAQFELKNVRDSDGLLFSDTDAYVAFQFLIGVKYAVTERIALSLGYKYFDSVMVSYADLGQPEIGGERFRIPVETSSILLGLSYFF